MPTVLESLALSPPAGHWKRHHFAFILIPFPANDTVEPMLCAIRTGAQIKRKLHSKIRVPVVYLEVGYGWVWRYWRFNRICNLCVFNNLSRNESHPLRQIHIFKHLTQASIAGDTKDWFLYTRLSQMMMKTASEHLATIQPTADVPASISHPQLRHFAAGEWFKFY
jgi:hypothetical protein